MLNDLDLPDGMRKSLQTLYEKTKAHDPQITESRFLQVIIAQWLEMYATTKQEPLHKNNVVLRNDLKMAIRISGKTQRQISQETGINYVYLSDVLRGKYEPGITFVLLLMRSLNCPPARLHDLFFLEPVP